MIWKGLLSVCGYAFSKTKTGAKCWSRSKIWRGEETIHRAEPVLPEEQLRQEGGCSQRSRFSTCGGWGWPVLCGLRKRGQAAPLAFCLWRGIGFPQITFIITPGAAGTEWVEIAPVRNGTGPMKSTAGGNEAGATFQKPESANRLSPGQTGGSVCQFLRPLDRDHGQNHGFRRGLPLVPLHPGQPELKRSSANKP